MGKNAKKYFRKVKRQIYAYDVDKERLLCDIKMIILEFESENKDCTYDDYVAKLGRPRDLVIEYVQEILVNNISGYVKKMRKKRPAIALCGIVVLCISVFAGMVVLDSFQHDNIYTEYQYNSNDIVHEQEQEFVFTIERVNADGTVIELTRLEAH